MIIIITNVSLTIIAIISIVGIIHQWPSYFWGVSVLILVKLTMI